jgi:hypothetical protein
VPDFISSDPHALRPPPRAVVDGFFSWHRDGGAKQSTRPPYTASLFTDELQVTRPAGLAPCER